MLYHVRWPLERNVDLCTNRVIVLFQLKYGLLFAAINQDELAMSGLVFGKITKAMGIIVSARAFSNGQMCKIFGRVYFFHANMYYGSSMYNKQ